MKPLENRISWLIPLAITFAAFLFFRLFYSYHLFFKEQIQLFMYTPDYLASYLKKPGWLASLSGDFLTQFFCLSIGGPLVVALLFLVEYLLVKKILIQVFKLKMAAFWALLPVFADFTSHLGLLYTPASTAGILYLLLLFWLLNAIHNKTFLIIGITFISVFGHWVLGSSIFLFPFLLLFKKDLYKPILTASLSLFIVIMVPYLTRPNYLLTLLQVYFYPAVNWKVFLVPGSFLLILLLNKISEIVRINSTLVAALFMLLVLAYGVKLNANFGLEKILALDTETYFGNNEKVLQLAEKMKLRNRVATYYTNIALAKKGKLPDRLLDFYQPSIHGLILPVTQYENWQTIFFSNELFYLLGDMNLAQHSTMLGNTFSPYNRSSRMIQRLAEINMVNEDYTGAEKFLRMLSKTLFHKKWAESRLKENHAGSQIRWLDLKRHDIAKTDTIRSAFDYINSIEFLVEQNPQNLIALDYLLCYHLLNKDLKSFKSAYDRFAKPQLNIVPKVYGEALLILLFREKASEETIADYKIQASQIHDFINYTSSFEEEKGNLNQLQNRFGKTYWFYFHFATMTEGEE